MIDPATTTKPAIPAAAADQTAELAIPETATTFRNGTVGQRLRAAREERALSVADVAQSLKLGPRQVDALENDDWSVLPGNTIIRGFVRNYGRLLGLDCEALMRELDAAHLEQTVHLDVSAGTSATLPQPGGRRPGRRDVLLLLVGLLAVGVATLLYFYVPGDFWRGQMTTLLGQSRGGPPAAKEPATTVITSSTANHLPSSSSAASTPPTTAPGITPEAAPSPASHMVTPLTAPNAVLLADEASAKGGAPQAVLRINFSQPGWAEVRDGRGQVVFSGVGSGGSARDVAGLPPFSLVVGNATQVSVHYQGRVIDLAPHVKGDVARLTVE